MTDTPPPETTATRRGMPAWLRWLAGGAVTIAALIAAALLFIDSDVGHRFIADQVGRLRPADGMRYSIGRIRGSVFARATLVDVRIRDPKGSVLRIPRAELDWVPLAWLGNRLFIRSLHAPVAMLDKLPEPRATGRRSPILPGFDIHVGALAIDRLIVGKAITGVPRDGRLKARADVRKGRALVDLAAAVDGSDRLRVMLDAEPDRDRFDIDVHARGTARGVLAGATGIRKPLMLDIGGKGRWQQWQGRAVATAGGLNVLDLALGNRAGRYTLAGTITPPAFATGKLASLGAPHVRVNGAATFLNRRLEGQLSLRSPALAVDTSGEIDLAESLYRNVRLITRLLQPRALVPNMAARNIEFRAILDGPFATAMFDYRLGADHVQVDKTGFDRVRAEGRGHLSKAPVIIPLRLSVAAVTGVGDVAGGILRNFVLEGALKADGNTVVGDALRFRSDKLSGKLGLMFDIKSGRYQVGLTGSLARYLIPGFGIVDVVTDLHLVPGAPGRGVRILGKGAAQVVRLDNAFFRSLAGGLPRVTMDLERTADGIIHLSNLVLTAPAIRFAGTGYRRNDGTLHIEGRGNQATYGPLALTLDGHIERPTMDLTLDHPNQAMGLKDVVAHLDPTAAGYDFTARGESLLGAFAGNGQLLLPPGGEGSMRIASLTAGGIKAQGVLAFAEGGLDGTVDLREGGLTGKLVFAPANGVQRIDAHLVADRASFANGLSIRRGRTDMAIVLDPAGASIEGDFRLGGLRSGSLSLSRAIGSVRIRGGTGQVIAKLSGSRGRAFDLNTVTDVAPDRYAVTATGTVDRREARLDGPAVITRDGDGWQLAPTRLVFADGQAQVSGRFTSHSVAIDTALTRLPLAILDIGYPDLGLSGVASGKLSFAQSAGQAPTGKADVTIRGLSRSGLVQTSRPIDLGFAGVLSANEAAMRAVMASDGKTIGRAQARLAPLGQGTLVARLANAPLFAQLRYDGPADTLWRLTAIEFFDMSGPVAIGADIGGKLNDPRIRGALRAKGARIESPVTGTVLTNVQATGQFAGSKLAISSFAADAGKDGRVTGTGTFDFAAVNGFGMDLRLQGTNALVINRDDIAATVTGPLAIRSDGSGGVISGDVRLDSGRYRLGQAAAASAVPSLNIREINVPGGDDEEEKPVKPWRMDIAAKAKSGLIVTGLGLSSEWSADLRIAGQPDNPQINGRADLVRGNYEFAGREFQLQRGVIRFTGEVPANPALDIEANADSTGLNATIRVQGQAIKPQISFTSTPALPEDELLSRLLFGTSITKLSAPEALQLASAVAALQSGGNGLNPINAVRRAVGLDRLRILPADPTVGRATSFAAGKYVTRKLYTEIITDGQGYSATQVEFQVTRWLSLLSTVSTLGRTSANVKVSKDY